MKKKFLLLLSSSLFAILLTACGGSTIKEKNQSPYTPAEEILLQQIETLFHDGKYRSVISKVRQTPEVSLGTLEFRSNALKYKAFSECLLSQNRNCRNTFRQLLTLNPAFELRASEADHPQWGTVFSAEKQRSVEAESNAE